MTLYEVLKRLEQFPKNGYKVIIEYKLNNVRISITDPAGTKFVGEGITLLMAARNNILI
jgi:hypothetical protein